MTNRHIVVDCRTTAVAAVAVTDMRSCFEERIAADAEGPRFVAAGKRIAV